MVTRRAGFTLVETLVALVVLSVGVLGAAGTALLAARILRQAEARQDAVAAASLLLDSLGLLPDPGAGEVRVGRFEASWTSAGGAVEVLLRLPGDTASAAVFRGPLAPVLPPWAGAIP